MTSFRVHPQVCDVLVTEDAGLVLLAEELVRVSPVAAVIVQRCRGEQTLSDLVAACREEFGEPEGHEVGELVEQTVGSLCAHQILTNQAGRS